MRSKEKMPLHRRLPRRIPGEVEWHAKVLQLSTEVKPQLPLGLEQELVIRVLEKPVGIDIAGLPVTLNGMVWTGRLDGLFGSISAKAGESRSEQPQLDRLLPA